MDLTNTRRVLVLASENTPMQDSTSIIDRQIGLADMGELVASGVTRTALAANCSWIQGFYKNATLALQFIKDRDLASMSRECQWASAGAKLSIHYDEDRTDLIKLADFIDETVGDIALDLRHIANQRPTLAYQSEQHCLRIEEFLQHNQMPMLAANCRVSVDRSGMNFHICL